MGKVLKAGGKEKGDIDSRGGMTFGGSAKCNNKICRGNRRRDFCSLNFLEGRDYESGSALS